MARNIEIKAHAANFDSQFATAKALADGAPKELHQIDTFFNVAKGRLKLREFPNQDAQLIYYHRANQAGPKLSDYHITNTPNAAELKYTLSDTVGVLAEVKKRRILLMRGRTRLHFDIVEGLGQFIELEVVLNEQETLEAGRCEANQLMKLLGIQSHTLIDQAYVDLLLA